MDFEAQAQQKSSDDPSTSSKLVLYSFWQSSCSWRVRFALNLKGLSYEYRAVNLGRGEHLSPDFERINPLKYVPVLVDGPVVVSDSYAILLVGIIKEKEDDTVQVRDEEQRTSELAIMTKQMPVQKILDHGLESYLEEKYPQKALLPADLHSKSLNLQVASIVSSSIQPLHMMGLLKTIEEKFGSEEQLPWAQSNIEKGFKALEELLKDFDGRYALGDEVYMADVFLAPQISVAIDRFNIDMSKFPVLARIYESYKTLPEFQASSPERQPDAFH